ncbi:hypothetical protein [Oxalobacter paraformigenes]|uniref:hypothetical protein n=1 Tax=Oxalobacter paraformigenes TaxID=556268 RepID=UPI0005949777|nr:hypothetical protein [Oxalobacter paraformigenes]
MSLCLKKGCADRSGALISMPDGSAAVFDGAYLMAGVASGMMANGIPAGFGPLPIKTAIFSMTLS